MLISNMEKLKVKASAVCANGPLRGMVAEFNTRLSPNNIILASHETEANRAYSYRLVGTRLYYSHTLVG